ncbi:MAG: hypothetical protein JWL84_1668 [Rhodospirillales bacterium]|nr:hypothetical protein [Rhodospirillales bacterium]
MTATLIRSRSTSIQSQRKPERQERGRSDGATLPPLQDGGFATVCGIRSTSFTVSVWVSTLACSAVLFIIWPPTASGTVVAVDYAGTAFKYGFGGLQAVLALCMICEHATLVPRPFFMLAALALSLIGLLSFTYVQLYRPAETSYGAALFPLLVCAMPAFIPPRVVHVNMERLALSVFRLLALGSVFQVCWQLVDTQGFLANEISHERTYILVFLLLLVGFERRLWACAFAIFLIAVSLYLRPSSTLASATAIALVAISLRLTNFSRLLTLLPYLIVGGLLIQNLVFAADPQVVEAVLNFETEFKQGELGSYSHSDSVSNSDFRFAIFRAVNDELNLYSPWIGKSFTGGVNVYVGRYLHWPGFLGFSEIHSDFLAILLQGGIIGYGLFAAIFVGVVRLASRSAHFAKVRGATRGEALLRSIPFMTCVFGFYISFNPLMPKVEYVLCFLILAPITVLCARQICLEDTLDTPLPLPAGVLATPGLRHR